MTGQAVDYPYTRGSRLLEPCHYMYPPYGGLEFLDAWTQDRSRCAQALEKRLAACAPGPGLALPGAVLLACGTVVGEWEAPAALVLRRSAALLEPGPAPAPAWGEAVRTAPLLRGLLRRCAARGVAPDDEAWLQGLARKFEVAKRLLPAYGPGLRKPEAEAQAHDPTAGIAAALDRCALLAACLGVCGGAGTDLRRLNALLKLNDLLCSELAGLSASAEASALALLALRAEARRVRGLLERDAPCS